MAAKRVRPLKLAICGKEWTVHVLSKSYFTRTHGKKTAAISLCDEKKIHLRSGEILKETVIHEIFHAYLWEHGSSSMNLTAAQTEELCAEMFSKHAEIILATAGIVLAAFGKNP